MERGRMRPRTPWHRRCTELSTPSSPPPRRADRGGWAREAQRNESEIAMQVKGGRLELLVPHMLRGQLLRPGFVRLSLRLGLTRQMPAWAKLQFTNNGITPRDLDHVLGRITSLESWADEWESLGRSHEAAAGEAFAARSEEHTS